MEQQPPLFPGATGELCMLSIADDLQLPCIAPLLENAEAEQLLAELLDNLPWQQPSVRLFGKSHPVPRLQSWHGDPGTGYRYSGLELQPEPWTPSLSRLRDRVSELSGRAFNSVLVNLYRDGQDSMGWHADDEPELGPAPWVASVSLGARRDFALRRKGSSRTWRSLPLEHNSLLLMPPAMQRRWQHALPKRARVTEPRVNLTFRRVKVGRRTSDV